MDKAAEEEIRTDDYIARVQAAIEAGDQRVIAQLSHHCHECGEEAGQTYDIHDVVDDYVIVGCEGYWQVDPALVGIDSPNWEPPAPMSNFHEIRCGQCDQPFYATEDDDGNTYRCLNGHTVAVSDLELDAGEVAVEEATLAGARLGYTTEHAG